MAPLKYITPNTNKRFSAIVIGSPGVGKTSLVRTIPADERVCMLSAEGGLLAVEDMIISGALTGVEISSLQPGLPKVYNMFLRSF